MVRNLWNRVLCVCFAVVAMVLVARAAFAQETLRGVALVIGNSEYEHLSPLANPGHDARAIEALLSNLGFETELSSDRDARRLARDLRDFVEDAEGADVAVLYYAGHGIEAGGENWLVPVDADISALDDAAGKLVPLSKIVAELQATVGVTIVLLDACRDNPFPPAATLKLASGEAAPVSAGGLAMGDGRGASRMNAAAPAHDNLGIVIGFAAEPGKVALDGARGENSPYAAALIRHLTALAGAEFGQVMRMVGEEVYLKTGGRQRPWVNESLRRLLYFGEAPAQPTGDEGDMLAERRQLLLTIAALPDLERRSVERAAAERGVPMDALYGMLRAMGGAVPDDPAKLEEVLRSEAERFAKVLAEREAVNSPDPEIIRLSALADTAESEGLLAKSIELRERANARFLAVESTLEDQEAALRERFAEGAAMFARSAGTKALAFDHLAAAQDYANAFARVDGRDEALAWRYRNAELVALFDHGSFKGDNAALERALAVGADALRLAERTGDRESWAGTQTNIGNLLARLGERDTGNARLEQAVEAFNAALGAWSRDAQPLEWAMVQNNLGTALLRLGEREAGTASLERAIGAFSAALQERTRERVPLDWAMTHNNLGSVLLKLGEREPGPERLEEAVAAFRTALEEWTRESDPLGWAMAQSNLGTALRTLGERQAGTGALAEAVEVLRASLEERARERVPLDWATTQNNLGTALLRLGEREAGTARLDEAAAAFRAALEEWTRERVPVDWAIAQTNLGLALTTLGQRTGEARQVEDAAAALRAALEEFTRERAPLQWASAQNNLGNALYWLGEQTGDPARLDEARAAYLATLEVWTRERVPLDWALARNNFASVTHMLGEQSGETEHFAVAAAAYREALEEWTRERAPMDWARANYSLGDSLRMLAMATPGVAELQESYEAYANAAEIWTVEQAPREWAQVQNNIGLVLLVLGERAADRDIVGYARDALAASWEVLRADGDDTHDAYFQELVDLADTIMAELE